MNKKFLIFTAPRSGSTVLTRTLDKHPQIFCAGELFHPTDAIYHAEWHFNFWGKKKKKGFSRKIFSIVNYVNGQLNSVKHTKKFYAAKEHGKGLRGFKLMIGHIKDFPSLWKYLCSQNLKIIVLIRKNVFREALSSFRARQTGVFHTDEDAVVVAEKKVYVDAALLFKRVAQLEASNNSILNLTKGMNRIVLYYEEFNEWNMMLNKVFNFLDVKRMDMPPALNKISAESWQDGVENFKEIEQIAKEKNYSKYLA